MNESSSVGTLLVFYLFLVVAHIAINIYSVRIIYKAKKILYGKGTLLGIIGFLRLPWIMGIAYGQAAYIISYILVGVSMVAEILPNSSVENESSPLIILLALIDLILLAMYGIGIFISAAKCKKWSQDENEREAAAESLKMVFGVRDKQASSRDDGGEPSDATEEYVDEEENEDEL